MTIREKELISLLINQNDPITSTQLAKLLALSVRTIKTTIATIKKEYPNLIISSQQGYTLNQELWQTISTSITSTSKSSIPQTSKERLHYLLKELAKSNEPLDIESLANQLYISENTLFKDFYRLKDFAREYHLVLMKDRDHIWIEGEERNFRRMISDVIYNEIQDTFMNIDSLREFFPEFDIQLIDNIIKESFSKNNIFINDYSRMNLLWHLLISLLRLLEGHAYQNAPHSSSQINNQVFQISNDISKQLLNHLNIQFNDAELKQLTFLINTSISNEKNPSEEPIDEILQDILKTINDQYGLQLDKSEYLKKFSIHITNMIDRLHNNYFVKNPLTESMRKNYPLVYDCAVTASQIIYKHTGFYPNADEIAFISFHIGTMLQSMKVNESKIKTAIYVPTYYDTSQKLVDQIEASFHEDIIIEMVSSDFQQISHCQFPLIISLLPINLYQSVQIGLFYNRDDERKIQLKINQIHDEQQLLQFQMSLKKLTREEFFKKNPPFNSKEDAIIEMCNHLEQKGFAYESLKNKVLAREELSSTAFNTIAIPHALKMDAKETIIYIVISDDGIQWNDTKVNLILLIAVNNNDKEIFREVYDILPNILLDEINLNKILQARSYQQFIEIITSL